MVAPTRGSQQNTKGNFCAHSGFTITKSDVTVFNRPLLGFMIGTLGDVAVTFEDGTSVVLPNLAPGVVHPIAPIQILETNTDDVGVIVGFY